MQWLGNGIAMAGLVYYNLGGGKVREIGTMAKVRCNELYGRKSNSVKIVIAMALVMGCVGLFAAVAVWFDIDLDMKGLFPLTGVIR